MSNGVNSSSLTESGSQKGQHVPKGDFQTEKLKSVPMVGGSSRDLSHLVTGDDEITQLKMPYVSNCFIRDINSEIISDMDSSIPNCSVGSDGASAVGKIMATSDLGACNMQSDGAGQGNSPLGNMGRKSKGKRAQKDNNLSITRTGHTVDQVSSNEQNFSDMKGKEKSLKAKEQDLKKREQHLSNNVKQLASVRSKVVQQEHVINDWRILKCYLRLKFLCQKRWVGNRDILR